MRSRLTLWVLLGLFCASPAAAQLASQTALVGTVSDSSGSVVPGASVVAVNTGTQDTYRTTTNAQGYYNIQFVRIGKYDISVTLSGFQTFKAAGVELTNGQVVRTNAVLKVGGVNETVTIQAASRLLDTDRATLSETINQRAIVDAPLNGRNVWNLASGTPGVLGGLNSDIGLSFRGAGQREIQNSLSLDGINASSNLLAATSMRPIADAVTEVQVQTGSTSAEYGAYLGVHINIVTKGGTNKPHGSLFEYYQSDALDQRGYFENLSLPKNPRKRNQYGVQMDGPLVIPKLYDGHNKTFFMAAYEAVRSRSQTTPFNSVPTALMRQGNFSEITTKQIRIPGTGPGTPNPAQFFAGNIIPTQLLSPVALKLLQYYPAPNLPGTAPGVNNLQSPSRTTDETDQILVRGDQNLGNKVRLSVRYNWHDNLNSNIGAIPIQGITQPRVNHNTLVSYTHTLRPTLLNDFRIGYHRIDFDTLNHFSVNGIPTAGADLGIPAFDGDVRFKNPGLPTINISNFSGLGTAGANWYQFDTTFQLSNVLAYNRGSHNVRTGVDLRRMATGRRAANDPRGRFDFTGAITDYSVADFMLGLPRTVVTAANQIQGHVGGWRNGFFVNDVWQAAPHLTLSLGLRYELNTPVQTYVGLATMLADDLETIIPGTLPSKGFKFHDPNKKDIAPRLGATYRLGEKTVLRAGFGIYYNPNQMNSFTFLTNNPPLAAASTLTSDASSPATLLSFDRPTGGVGVVVVPDMISPTRHLPNARKDQWSVDIQRELARSTVVDLEYVGSHTQHLDRSFFNNTPQPGPTAVDPRRPSQRFKSRRMIQNDLVADYDAVSIILRKRMSRGLQVDAHYTWSKTRDMATHSNGGGQTMNNYDIWADYGPASWDIPHRFVAGYIYELPFFKSSSQPFLKYVVAGWQIGGGTTAQSGSPVNVTLTGDPANIGINGLQRPNLVGPVPTLNCQTLANSRQLVNCYDSSAFQLPAAYTFGNAPRNVLRGPKSIVTDLSLMKNFPLGGGRQFQFRAEIFNAFNTVNYLNPNGVFNTPQFGQISSAGTMRQIQLGARVTF